MSLEYTAADSGRSIVGREVAVRCFGGSSFPARITRFTDLGLYPMYLVEWTMATGKVVSEWFRRDDFTL